MSNNDSNFNRFNAPNDVQDHFSSLLSPRPFVRQQHQPFYYHNSANPTHNQTKSPSELVLNNRTNDIADEFSRGAFNGSSSRGFGGDFKDIAAYGDDDVIAPPLSGSSINNNNNTNSIMSHQHHYHSNPNRHLFREQQQQQEFPTSTSYYYPTTTRFGSMDRLRNNNGGSGVIRDNGGAKSFFDQPRDEFERKFFENTGDDEFEFDRKKFFGDPPYPSSIHDDFEEQRRKFFDDNRRPTTTTTRTKMSTPPPLMPEWGYVQQSPGSSSGISSASTDRMDRAGGGRSSPFASLDRRRAPMKNGVGESAPFTTTYGGSSERIIPIRVEGRRGGGNIDQSAAAPPKPVPPYKPPDLAQKGSTSGREVPIFQHQPQQPQYTSTTNQSFKQPERQAPSMMQQNAGSFANNDSSNVSTKNNVRDTPSSLGSVATTTTATPAKLLKFEPDALIQKLSEAPNLSNRLAGKITSFDEFSDILSQLPKQPHRPSVDRELDEKLAPLISSGKFKPAAASQEQFFQNDKKQAPPQPKDSVPQSDVVVQQQQKEEANNPITVHKMIVGSAPISSTKGQDQECVVPARADSASEEAPPTVRLFDDACKDTSDEFFAAGQKIGGEVAEITNLTKHALDALRSFLWNAAGSKKPTDDASLSSLLKPISEKIESIQSFTNAKRASQFFNHLSAVSEGVPALGWITISPTPGPYVKEMIDAAQFYVNRVLKDFKEKDKVHSDWVKLWVKLLTDMQKYIKQNHTTGLVWNSCPGAKTAGAMPQQQAKLKGPPGPPPPPPPSYLLESKVDSGKGSGDDADSRAALFADINKGLDITKNLKKITDDMKTHKNPELRQGSTVPAEAASSQKQQQQSPAKAGAAAIQHPPKVELEGGKKWVVEYVKNDKNVIVNVGDMKQVAYIYKCSNAVIQFKGKINSITMDSCEKTSIVFEDLVSCVEIINCQRAQIQSLGKMPTIAVQKTDGCQIYLCNESLNTEIITSKSSEMNVLIPNASGEYDEFAVPEQYKTVWDGKKLQTTVVDV